MCDRFALPENEILGEKSCELCDVNEANIGIDCYLLRCEHCDKLVCPACRQTVEVLENTAISSTMVKRTLCTNCIYDDNVEAILDPLSLIWPYTGKAIVNGEVELCFSPSDQENDVKVVIKRV